MKTITLRKLTLQDWRGQNRVVNFGHNTEIKGRNKSGKSTIFNAWLWLLTSCDEADRSNYKLFDETLEQTYDNAKEASVEAVLDIDGSEYILKKTAKPLWVRKRGRETYEKANTDFYSFAIDGIERSAGDYKKFIEENFAPIEKLKLMLNIRFYQLLDWKELRGHFEGLVGELSISDFKGDYNCILSDLNKYPIQQVKESYKSRMKPIKASIDSLPVTIETLKANLPDISGLDAIQEEIESAKKQIADIDAQISGSAESNIPYIEKRNTELKQIAELEKEYAEAESQYNLKPIEEANKIKAEIYEIDAFNQSVDKANEAALKEFERKKEGLALLSKVVSDCEKRHKELTEQNNEVKARQFTADTCAYCGQPLQGDKLEEAKKKFFEQKEKDHQYIVSQGKQNREYWNKSLAAVENLQKEIDEGAKIQSHKLKTDLENKLADLRANFIPYKETTEGKEKAAKISYMKANLTDIPVQDNEALINMKQSLISAIETNSKKLGLKDTYDKQMQAISQKQVELKENSIELARLEGMLNKAVAYEQERAQIVSDKVNGMFDYISVVMTSTNKSGDIIPDCRILDLEGVSTQVTNAASKVRCGIDLSLGFQKFYGLNLPIFIDESHTVDADNYPLMDNQIIKMWNNGGEFSVEIKE